MVEFELITLDVVVQAVFLMAFLASAWVAVKLGFETRQRMSGFRD